LRGNQKPSNFDLMAFLLSEDAVNNSTRNPDVVDIYGGFTALTII
jgi:hypothetical protein